MNDRIQEIRLDQALRLAIPQDKRDEYIAYLLSEYDRLTEGHDVALKALEKAEKFITTMMEFYGEGLTVYNWHQNGDGEPWDNFFDNNMEGDELESIRTALSHLKG